MATPDVRSARAQLKRAAKHLDEFHDHWKAHMADKPCTVEVEGPSPLTGEARVYMTLTTPEEAALALGDFMTSLRKALDYLIQALAQVSHVAATKSHQFPIYTKRENFEKRVMKGLVPQKRGALDGLRFGLRLIEAQQPFNVYPAEPDGDTLALLQRFSNTDKHRDPIIQHAIAHGRQTVDVFPKWTLVHAQKHDSPDGAMALGQRVKLVTYRYGHPVPKDISARVTLNLEPLVSVPAMPPDYPKGALLGDLGMLDTMHRRVASIVSLVANVDTPDR